MFTVKNIPKLTLFLSKYNKTLYDLVFNLLQFINKLFFIVYQKFFFNLRILQLDTKLNLVTLFFTDNVCHNNLQIKMFLCRVIYLFKT